MVYQGCRDERGYAMSDKFIVVTSNPKDSKTKTKWFNNFENAWEFARKVSDEFGYDAYVTETQATFYGKRHYE